MPALENARHERFAQLLAKGTTATDAYAESDLVARRYDQPDGFYVYLLIDPRNDRVFYVGKGTGSRALVHERNARSGREPNGRKAAALAHIRQAGLTPVVHILEDGLSEAAAYRLERQLILRAHKRLTNLLPGQQTEHQRVAEQARAGIAQLKPLCVLWRERRTPAVMRIWAQIHVELRKIIATAEAHG